MATAYHGAAPSRGVPGSPPIGSVSWRVRCPSSQWPLASLIWRVELHFHCLALCSARPGVALTRVTTRCSGIKHWPAPPLSRCSEAHRSQLNGACYLCTDQTAKIHSHNPQAPRTACSATLPVPARPPPLLISCVYPLKFQLNPAPHILFHSLALPSESG